MKWLTSKRLGYSCLFILIPLFILGCSREERVGKHLERANSYFKSGQYEEAEIEYKNVLRLAKTNAVAISHLGILYHEQGRLIPALLLLQQAKQLVPDDLDARVKLGWSFFAARKFKEAREEALYILGKQPTQEEALILLGETGQSTNELAEVIQHLEELRPQAENQVGYKLAWSNVYFRQNKLAEAEAILKEALLLDPKSAAAHATLGNFYWSQDNLEEADRFLQAAADLAPPRSTRRLRYAEFKIRTGDVETGKARLAAITETTPDFLPAWTLQAELALREKNYEESESLLKIVLTQDPINFDAVLMSGKVKMAKGEPGEAVTILEKLNQAFPGIPTVQYQLALAQMLNKDEQAALASLTEVVTRNPTFTEAVLLQSNLNIQQGDYATAIVHLRRLLQARPRQVQAHILLAVAYRAQGNPDEALAVYERLIQFYPDNPQAPFLKGLIYLQQKQQAEARQAFNAALERAPQYPPAVEQLVNMDLDDKDFTTATQRVQKMLEASPEKPLPHFLMGKVFFTQGEYDQAEAAVNKAIGIAPEFQAAYMLLVRVYVAANKHQQALEKLQAMLAENPKNKSALLQVGMIQDALKNYSAARDAYQQLLNLDPEFTPALNNLAYLYSEHLGDLDRAYELAQKAKDRLPDDPYSGDTLGWILHKRGEYSRALVLLKQSAEQLPNQPEVLYHLGMTYYMMRQQDVARETFQRALQASQEFPGRDDISRRLSFLDLDPKTAGPDVIADLEKARQSEPGDLFVLTRLAQIYERDGAAVKEVEVQKQILDKDPNNLAAVTRLAWLYSDQPDRADAALNLAKRARDMAPDNPDVAYLLGRLVFRTGDSSWALSLLQESARKLPQHPGVLYHLAWSQYSLGRLEEARKTMQSALPKLSDAAQASVARQLLTMIELGLNPQKVEPAAAEIDKILAANPNDVPAQYVAGLIQENKGQYAQAGSVYERILGTKGYEFFAPARRQLAILMVEKLGDYTKAYDHAVKARETYPADARVAKVLGIVSFKRNDYARAVQLLTESTKTLTADAEAFYYLGLAHAQLKQNKEGIAALQKALATDANAPFAAEAKRVLDSLSEN